MDDFLRSLATAELILPAFEPKEGDVHPSTFRVVTYEGHTGVAAYTSRQQLVVAMKGRSTLPCVSLTGSRLATGWDRKTSLLLNPGGVLGLAVKWRTVVGWGGDHVRT
ncbi:MAG: SseB family protein [Actinomycetota bacterium]|nr:SseB family protein [Actinomycetota bacterium]